MLEDLSYKPKRHYKTPNEELVDNYLAMAREELEKEHRLQEILKENSRALIDAFEGADEMEMPVFVDKPAVKSSLKENAQGLNIGLQRAKTDLGPIIKGPRASTPTNDLISESATELSTKKAKGIYIGFNSDPGTTKISRCCIDKDLLSKKYGIIKLENKNKN